MKNTNESGRSMVEMLGVLAIIGVLSVGGIMGYTTAMRKYKANEIAQAITMTVMAAKSANLGTGITTEKGYSALTGEASLPQGVFTNATGTNAQKNGIYARPVAASGSGASAVAAHMNIDVYLDDKSLCSAVQAIIGTNTQQPMYTTGTQCSDDTGSRLEIFVKN